MKRTELAVLIVIMVIAAGFRLVNLQTTPPGLYPDEAMNGNDAIQAIDSGHPQLFYPNNNGREGLFINLQAVSIYFFGNHPWSLRLVSALIGILTVLGTYLLTKRLFDNWEIAAIAAFLMATGFWHVNFSRIGFRSIMAPFCAVWGFYYLFTAFRSNRLWHWLLAGLWLGLGFHTYIAFRVMPAVLITVIIAYLWALRYEFSHDKYFHTRQQVWGGIALTIGVMILVLLPLAMYFSAHPADLVGRSTQLSVFATDHPYQQAIVNFVRMLGMFVFHGDENWRHNFSGQPVLYWPVAALFAVGFIRSFLKIGRTLRTHGHPSTVQVLLVSWLFIGLVPAAISNEGIPHALRSLIVAPAVYIIAAEGLWWLFTWMRHWYEQRDQHPGEAARVTTFALVAFLAAVGIADGSRYFVDWAHDPHTASYFNQNYVDIAARINELPRMKPVYVVVRDSETTANGFAISAETVMFLTDTSTPAKQKSQNIFYLHESQFKAHQYPAGAMVIHLDP